MKCSQEVRAVERRVLLETLASQLPRDTIQYSSQLQRIEATPNGDTLLELVDGSKLLAKVSHFDVISLAKNKIKNSSCTNLESFITYLVNQMIGYD